MTGFDAGPGWPFGHGDRDDAPVDLPPLEACPRCGDRHVLYDVPGRPPQRLCAVCLTETGRWT